MADGDLVGVSVGITGKMHFLRFTLASQHLKRLGDPERIGIRGQAANGFVLAPDRKGLKLAKPGLNYFYLQTTLAHFELSKRLRKRINVRPEFENGHIRIPPLPPAWIDVAEEFAASEQANGEAVYGEANSIFKLHGLPGNGTSRLTSESVQLNGSPTAPLPKPVVDYTVPSDPGMAEMQARLGATLAEARELIKQMELKSGMKFVLDRHLRLVVAL